MSSVRALVAGCLRQVAAAPNGEDDRVEEEFEDTGGNNATNHGCGDALHHVSAALRGGRPHDRQKPEKDGANRHNFGPNALDGAFDNGVLQVRRGVHSTCSAEFVPSVVEVKEHDNAGFGIEAGKGNETDPDSHAEIVAEEIEQPERADEGEGDGE